MHTTRRDFLRFSLAGSSMVALTGALPNFLGRAVANTPQPQQGGARDTILVVVQLTGGNDGLNTVIPFNNPDYVRLRPTLRIQNSLRVNDSIGLHPAMTGLHGLLQDNALCIVQGVGYPNPNQSHFRSMDIWHAASTAETLNEGWIGRALRHIPAATSFHLANPNESAPLALTGAPARVPSIATLDDFQLRLQASSASDRRQQRDLLNTSSRPAENPPPSLLDFVQRTAVQTYASSQRLSEIGRNYQPRVPYPTSALGNHLKLAAQLIDANIGARLFYVTHDGFDTHAAQAPLHTSLLRDVSDSITAFYRDMAARGQGNRVLIVTFSEFGRRGHENGSQGTDHGSGAPMLFVGGRVRSGLVGEHPRLVNLDNGNLPHAIDFRQVYATLLDQWLGVPSRPVLGQAFDAVDILRRA
ncbi:MAG: DUF1501 domain-containing protein [Planctomycetes bacterium]|nr:DUF1501 domain-containing protein [Planctomycetota bacterium]